jgi:hypothetical protein
MFFKMYGISLLDEERLVYEEGLFLIVSRLVGWLIPF